MYSYTESEKNLYVNYFYFSWLKILTYIIKKYLLYFKIYAESRFFWYMKTVKLLTLEISNSEKIFDNEKNSIFLGVRCATVYKILYKYIVYK